MEYSGLQLHKKIFNDLLMEYGQHEAESLAWLILEDALEIRKADILANSRINFDSIQQLDSIVERLNNHEPIQHILGFAWFCDRKFKVTRDTLIPRQETEELVAWILEENNNKPIRVLDVGTGSGIIGISLKLERPAWNVTCLDVSVGALEVARANAEKLGVQVHFERMDILRSQPQKQYDIIVSNPPYVTVATGSSLPKNVKDYDPDLALYVPDDDALLFYRRTLELSDSILKPDGKVYFEISEEAGSELSALCKRLGFENIHIRKDLNDKDRMVRCY